MGLTDELVPVLKKLRLSGVLQSLEVSVRQADPLPASAAMDRLLHDAHALVLEGDSYRNPTPGRRRRAAEASQESKT
ncbi:hypothetical protein BE08_31995 [Sorangium cellulosum]|uniref:Uncharacterized protein n=1 Tax=Sorangium cellulosum TaxID=56 RepID=A0A150PKJ2_SORCE|nr:hypothetical protein BE08_31995 [Sorangium cellulosum]